MQPVVIKPAFVPGPAGTVVAVEKDDRLVGQTGFLPFQEYLATWASIWLIQS